MKTSDYEILNRWKNEMTRVIRLKYPNLSDKKVDSFLEKQIKKNLKNTDAVLYNNYIEKNIPVNLLDVTEFFYKKKPIPTPHGVFFKRHDEEQAPSNMMVSNFLKQRKIYKKEMSKYLGLANDIEKEIGAIAALSNEKYKEFMYKFKTFNMLQNLEKVKANSFYGASGLRTSVFYNLHTALSTTGVGQCLISTSAMAFESFLSNNVKFMSMDECIIFINNVVGEQEHRKFQDSKILDEDIDIIDVKEKLMDTFNDISLCNEDLLYRILRNLNQENLNRLYYKNNLYDFFRNSNMKTLLRNIIRKVDSFKNPNEIPESIQRELSILYDIVKEFVFYNYEVFDRINRLKYHKRAVTVTIDTDSSLSTWESYYSDIVENKPC